MNPENLLPRYSDNPISDLITYLTENKAALDLVPFPVYCTELQSGIFEYANPALYDLLDCHGVNLKGKTGLSFYEYANTRYDWAEDLRKSGNKVTARIVELQRPYPGRGPESTAEEESRRGGKQRQESDGDSERRQEESNRDGERLFVLDCCRVFSGYVLGVLCDVTDIEIEQRRQQKHQEIYWNILNDPKFRIGVGIHVINAKGEVLKVNAKEREMFSLRPDWEDRRPRRLIAELSVKEEQPAKACRVRRKALTMHKLTIGEHRTFITQDEQQKAVPVNITDFGVPDPSAGQGRYSEIVTVVQDEAVGIEKDTVLSKFGVRNPLLNAIDVCTFIKVKRRYLEDVVGAKNGPLPESKGNPDELVFAYGNTSFVNELIALSDQSRTEIIIDGPAKIIGRTDLELFREFAGGYSEADRLVLGGRPWDERIEKHPGPTAAEPIDVQAYKIPLCRGDENEIIGVQGFYWAAQETGIRGKLEQLYDPWSLLDSLPVVFQKDNESRFTYVNNAFLDFVKKRLESAGKTWSISDIIGKRYEELFTDGLGAELELDDQRLLKGEVDQVDRDVEIGNRPARVKKTAIKRIILTPGEPDRREIVGVQGIFWYERERVAWIDWHYDPPILHVGDRKTQVGRIKQWQLFDLLLKNLNETVTYQEIAKRRLIIKEVDEKGIANLQTCKGRLEDEWTKARDRLGTTVDFDIIVPEPHAYKMVYKPGENAI